VKWWQLRVVEEPTVVWCLTTYANLKSSNGPGGSDEQKPWLTVRRESGRDGRGRRWRQRAAASTVRCPARRRSLRTRRAGAPSPPSRRYSTVSITSSSSSSSSSVHATRRRTQYDVKSPNGAHRISSLFLGERERANPARWKMQIGWWLATGDQWRR